MNSFRPSSPRLLHLFDDYTESANLVVFVRNVARHYSPGTLQRLAASSIVEVRRGAVLALTYLGDSTALPVLGPALRDNDQTVRRMADTACRSVWNRFGSKEQQRGLSAVIRLNADGRFLESLEQSNALVHDLPAFAEAWYQRGAARYQLGDLALAIADWRAAIRRNPYHFVAVAAIGESFSKRSNMPAAREAFREALRLNPEFQRVKAQLAAISPSS